MTNEDVEALGLPFLTAKELKKRLEDLKRDLNSKDAKMAEDKLAEKSKVQVPAASAPNAAAAAAGKEVSSTDHALSFFRPPDPSLISFFRPPDPDEEAGGATLEADVQDHKPTLLDDSLEELLIAAFQVQSGRNQVRKFRQRSGWRVDV